ncbi:broad specificity phosphatase PhoE [Clostridium beijerinckii]|uniref:phosphoglycerate mutase family protein n=1 Tax=Clostridium beijerinckii TaxID=1520 RepID=UPI00156FC01A|nr:phosphoglycerate mutase family protein [Clostridium beijerinckii]NRT33992.1 broad specificity phosphatase PhoE [Clostridium beijerinckii]NRT46578.1 broad specificity phosphatase PhoE [Clostridium beijerinckii]NRZ19417.1 broad specificity phosphatase PhoE [Clostridium beijerinckii]
MSNIITVLLIRHADIDIPDGVVDENSISLNSSGEKRAQDLVNIVEKAPISAVYTSNIHRSIQTAQPILDRLHSSIEHKKIDSPEKIAEDILSNYKGQNVLVIHHSNTVPEIIQILSNKIVEISGFDDFYIVNIYTSDNNENKYTNVVHLKYGD